MATPTATPKLMDLFRPEWSRDPYKLYQRLRERETVYWDEWMRSWVVLGYDDIVRLSKDERLSGARIQEFHDQLPPQAKLDMAPLARALSDMMLFNEPPRHTKLRRLMKPGLTPRFIRGMRPAIEGLADTLLSRVRGRMDIIRDFSEPLTRGMIAHLAGMPDDSAHLLEDWPGLLHEFYTQSDAVVPLLESLRSSFDEVRAGDGTDLFSQMIAAQLEKEEFTEEEIFGNFLLLIDAGQATTTHLIGNAVLALLRNPDQLELLRQNPDLLPNAAHELMRYDTSVQFTARTALADIGDTIKAGDSVTLVLGSGNHDPAHYTHPDELDVTRRANDHLSFGHGIHYCLGAALSLAEIEIAIGKLLDRSETIELLVDEPEWLDSINFRFMKSLPIRI
jgi:pimeloyl-[acyl-carrier protein] synthase